MSKILINETVWIIMTKDRKYLAKGVPRNRYLVALGNTEDKKRILTYKSKGRAIAAFSNNGFYNSSNYVTEDFEAVEVEMVLQVKEM